MNAKYAAKLILNSLLVILLVNFATADYRSDYPGPYCAKRDSNGEDGCCNNRKDVCSVPISSKKNHNYMNPMVQYTTNSISATLCYCDEFCKRETNSDCCPDYESHCLGQKPDAFTSCAHKGYYFSDLDGPVQDNCNQW